MSQVAPQIKLSNFFFPSPRTAIEPLPTQATPSSRHLVLVNHNHLAIARLYVSSSHTGTWGNSVLGKKALKPGQERAIELSSGSKRCRYDLKAVYTDGSYDEMRYVELGAVETATTVMFSGQGGECRQREPKLSRLRSLVQVG